MSIRTRVRVPRIRRPEYTGENRCYPCTLFNLALASIVSIVGGLISPPLGTAILLLSLLAIYYRGYVVPGTPTITRRYVPDRILAWFDKESEPARDETSDFNPERALLEWGVLEWCEGGTDLCFHESVRSAVEHRVAEYRDDPTDRDRIARMFDAEVDAIREPRRGPTSLFVHGRLQRWPSEVAMLSDTAINDALASSIEGWAERPLDHRLQVLEGLRPFHERCPACDGELETSEQVVESCCRSRDVFQVRCLDCESVLFEIDAEAIDSLE